MHTYKRKFRAAAINMQNTHTYTSFTYNSGSVKATIHRRCCKRAFNYL